MKHNDKIVNPIWKQIACTCDHSSILTEFPIMDCIHCKCEKSENSIPKNDFTKKHYDLDGNLVSETTVTEIEIVRDEKYNQCIGWRF